MNSLIKLALVVCSFVVLGGCAHSIRINPDEAGLPKADGIKRVNKSIAYFISEEERNRRVITAGGGGDKVEYAPYRELEAGIYRVFNNVFENVYVLKTADDKAFIAEKGISLVFRPTIATTSSSSSVLTWPPTDFEVIIEIKALDKEGKVIWTDTVSGKGNAEFSEFKSDFSLSAKRASASALAQLQARLLASPAVRSPSRRDAGYM